MIGQTMHVTSVPHSDRAGVKIEQPAVPTAKTREEKQNCLRIFTTVIKLSLSLVVQSKIYIQGYFNNRCTILLKTALLILNTGSKIALINLTRQDYNSKLGGPFLEADNSCTYTMSPASIMHSFISLW